MSKKTIIGLAVTISAGLILCWSAWVSNSVTLNSVAIAETRVELRTEIKSMSKTLDLHYGLLKEIRDDQKRKDRR